MLATLGILTHFPFSSSIPFVSNYTSYSPVINFHALSLTFSTSACSSRSVCAGSAVMGMESVMGMEVNRKRFGWLDNKQENVEFLIRANKGYEVMHVETDSLLYPILTAEEYLERAPKIPEDLYHLLKKAVAIRNHLRGSEKDKDSRYGLICVESRIQRFVRYYKKTKKLPPVWRYFKGKRKAGDKGRDKRIKYIIEPLRKLLIRVLRHTASELNLDMTSGFYVKVRDLLNLDKKTFTGVLIRLMILRRQAVRRDNKCRFSLIEKDKELLIRANEGHTIKLLETESLLETILSPKNFPVCVHGTSKKNLKVILKTGLKCMEGSHVHFSCALPTTDGELINGMSGDVSILIFLDISKAIQESICRGDEALLIGEQGDPNQSFDGIVPVKYFERIESWPDRELIPFAHSS